VCAFAATSSEVLQAWIGITWSILNVAFAVVDTPIAQLSAMLTPFGVSGIVYFVNFLVAEDRNFDGLRRWRGPMLSLFVLTAAWSGGLLLRSNVDVQPLSFTAMLVQPHQQGNPSIPWTPWLALDHLTRKSLDEDGPVDLIVWPESSLSESFSFPQAERGGVSPTRLSLQQFARQFQPVYGTNCLVGVGIVRSETENKYGYQLPTIRRYNCGCLVTASDKAVCHEKRVLVPFREGEPDWMASPEIRKWIPDALKLTAQFTPGRDFRVLRFTDGRDKSRTIAVSVCYESFFPWLPQYHTQTPVDAIVHILYDGDAIVDSTVLQRQIEACRFRAIETRTWNLVCSTLAGTAIIDPTGCVVRELPPVARVLRTDVL
jgi:apolipoprotein N-acyltransferase